VAPRLKELGLTINCEGGGRIKHQNNSILVYGYSVVRASAVNGSYIVLIKGYGQADHSTTVDILRRNYLHYPADNITFSNSGY
jgi:hypothetical protein